MNEVAPVWQKRNVAPEVIQQWRDAVERGRRQYYDMERRATYPQNADADTLVLAEHYRLRYHHARILKALSYFLDVTPNEMADVTGIHKALLSMEVRRVADRLRISVETSRWRDNTVKFYRLTDPHDRDEIRAVINSSWLFCAALP